MLSRSFDIKIPRSAIMLSFLPKVLHLAKPLRRTISLSEKDPGYKLLIKMTAPDGAIK